MLHSDIKKLAKKNQLTNKLTYCQNLDQIVKALGSQSWNHYCAKKKEKYETQENVKIQKSQSIQEEHRGPQSKHLKPKSI